MIPITITHLGAETSVTGSCHLVRAMEEKIDDLSWGFELYETFTLKNAGHILGSCFIQFSFPKSDKTPYRFTFSGDLGCRHAPIIPDPHPPDVCDLLILESTYGDRNHENRADRLSTLAKTLDHALSDSGIVYIPAFAPGRDIVEGRTPAKAAIHRLTGYSAHADQQTLCDWVAAMPEPPGEIRLVHVSPTRDFNYVLDTCKGFNDLAGIKLTSTTYKLQGIG
jgi:Cft2 family RNA processing exonuclease